MELEIRAFKKLAAGYSAKSVAKELGVKTGWVKQVVNFPVNFDFGVEIEVIDCDYDLFERLMVEQGFVPFMNLEYHETPYNFDIYNMKHWRFMEDSSVDQELVSPILRGEEGLLVLKDVLEILNKCSPKIDYRCGLHVHISRSYFLSDRHVMNFQNTYAMLEASIDKMLAKSRRIGSNQSSQYCKAIRRDDNLSSRGYDKYKTVSTKPKNTVEVRHHQGTTSYEKIDNWVRILAQIVKFSEKRFLSHTAELSAVLNSKSARYAKKRSKELS